MSGPKHLGHILTSDNDSHIFQPSESMINFAVPVRSIASSELSPLCPLDIKAGLITYILDKIAEQSDTTKTYKLCLDGKKINASTAGREGDVDLWGFEHEPTLSQRRAAFEQEKTVIQDLSSLLNNRLSVNQQFLSLMKHEDVSFLKIELLNVVKNLSKRVKSLRETKVKRDLAKERLQREAGEDWRKSKLVFVISGLMTTLYDIDSCIKMLLEVIDQICQIISVINHASYPNANVIDMSKQMNYRHLVTQDEEISETRFIRQRTPKWHEIRQTAVVTGSTLNAAIGLGTLKQQCAHFDEKIFHISKPEYNATTRERMAYGTDNEKNAVATLVAKVLPVLNPELIFIEEGCYKHFVAGVPLVVSPDGSCRVNEASEARFGVEIKCPFPGKVFTTPVFYTMPHYYVTQVLSEMQVLNVNELYFVCYSSESTTVQKVTFNAVLWEEMEGEIVHIYGDGHQRRPTRKSEGSLLIKDKISDFLRQNVEFILEIPSVTGRDCLGEKYEGTELQPFCVKHTAEAEQAKTSITLEHVLETLYNATSGLERSYQLTRNKASEFLGFMLSDLDREYRAETLHAVPVAYGLKGYSLPTSTLRQMTEFVLNECAQRGLYVPVCSFDGQWYKLVVRDRYEKPLTVHQLQKDVYGEVKRMTKSAIIKVFTESNKVEAKTIEELQQQVNMSKEHHAIIVNCKIIGKSFMLSSNACRMIKNNKKVIAEQSKSEIGVADDVLNAVPSAVLEKITPEEIEVVHAALTDTNTSNNRISENAEVVDPVIDHAVLTDLGSEDMTNDNNQNAERDENPQHQCILNQDDFKIMLSSLQDDKTINRSNKWNIALEYFLTKLVDAKTINNSFLACELQVCIRPVIGKLKANGVKMSMSVPKHTMVNVLSRLVGNGSEITPTRRKTRFVAKLQTLAKVALQRISKEHLNVIMAENIFPSRLSEWYNDSPYGKEILISSIDCKEQAFWYSRPEMNDAVGYFVFMILDAYHQLCGARRLFCSKGIPAAGIYNKHIYRIAEESEQNGCGLNIALVKDLIDRQSVAYAVQTFSEKVEYALCQIGAENEAEFCRLIRKWYESEDEPGIPALDRCRHRLALRSWLVRHVNFGKFPPHGSYVKDIPIVLYEGLLTGIERRLQLFLFTKSGSYNVRAIGSLDIENFFGTFQNIDPLGTGILRPDSIPTAISVAVELMDAKLDTNRCFHMHTSSAKVYPTNQYEMQKEMEITGDEFRVRDVSNACIVIRDHGFDKPHRARGAKKRKKGDVAKPEQPARKPQTVREHHRVHEAKILPHVRRGLILDD